LKVLLSGKLAYSPDCDHNDSSKYFRFLVAFDCQQLQHVVFYLNTNDETLSRDAVPDDVHIL